MMSSLLHPELFANIPVIGAHTASLFDEYANTASTKPDLDEDVSIVIRTLNEAQRLESLIGDIRQQQFQGEVEIIVVDNESSDETPAVAKDLGATVVTLARNDFTYPRSMNLGVEAASHDLVWLTVGHALPSTTQLLHGAALNFADSRVAGAFGVPILSGGNASLTERLIAMGAGASTHLPRQAKRAQPGTMGATSAMIRKQVWQELGRFDERYETGGEDTALAARMLEAGFKLVREPLMYVHHSHGLGPIDFVKQLGDWINMTRGPRRLDKKEITRRRGHLNFK